MSLLSAQSGPGTSPLGSTTSSPGEISRSAVAQHLSAAGIGRGFAADHARALGFLGSAAESLVGLGAFSCSVCSARPASTVVE